MEILPKMYIISFQDSFFNSTSLDSSKVRCSLIAASGKNSYTIFLGNSFRAKRKGVHISVKKGAQCQLKEKNKECFTGKDYKEASQVVVQVIDYSMANKI